jgi:cytidine deaminase
MKKILFSAEYLSYPDEKSLNSNDAELLAEAKKALKTSYSPYSKFKVGAAVLLENGEIVPGSNQENAAFPVTICAERNAAFAAAVRFPGVTISAVAITVETQSKGLHKPVPPCGSCRQVLLEYELRQNKDIKLILQGDSGEVYTVSSLKDILPLLFDASFL